MVVQFAAADASRLTTFVSYDYDEYDYMLLIRKDTTHDTFHSKDTFPSLFVAYGVVGNVAP